MTVLRSTQEVAVALVSYASYLRVTRVSLHVGIFANPKIRLSSQNTEVLFTPENVHQVRLSSQTVEVLITEHPPDYFVSRINAGGHLAADLDVRLSGGNTWQLHASINGTGSLSSYFSIQPLRARINTAATVNANLRGIWRFAANITTNSTLAGNLESIVYLTSSISSSASVTADVRENIEYLVADISGTGRVGGVLSEHPPLNVPWHAGNTILWTQTASAAPVYDRSIDDTLTLTDNLELIFGARNFDLESTLNFIDSAEVNRVLPEATASSTLTLIQSLAEDRPTTSYLILIQSATGIVTYLSGVATSNLNLTDTVSTSQSIFAVDVSSQLDLDSESYPAAVADRSPDGSTLYLFDHAYGALLEYRFVDHTYGIPTTSSEIIREQAHRHYVILQAPYDGIQATLILPAPLFGDTENIISNLTLRKSINGTKRTYIKTSNSKMLKYTFSLDRLIGLALEGFIDSYNGANIRLTNWKGEVWRVNLMTNPVDFVQTHRAEPGGDRTEVNLEFEGIKIDG